MHSCNVLSYSNSALIVTGKTNNMLHYCITFDIHFSLCKVHLFQCTGRHLRLRDMCGLFMLKIIIFEKFSGCGIYSGALNSPEITVGVWFIISLDRKSVV